MKSLNSFIKQLMAAATEVILDVSSEERKGHAGVAVHRSLTSLHNPPSPTDSPSSAVFPAALTALLLGLPPLRSLSLSC